MVRTLNSSEPKEHARERRVGCALGTMRERFRGACRVVAGTGSAKTPEDSSISENGQAGGVEGDGGSGRAV